MFNNKINCMYISDATKKVMSECKDKQGLSNKLKSDFVQILNINSDSSFLMRVMGDSMKNAGINSKDLIIADRKIKSKDDDIVIAEINKKLTIKRLFQSDNCYILKPENDSYEDIFVSKNDAFSIWGVVTQVIHSM